MIKKLLTRIRNYFYTTYLGQLYFDYLLWLDAQDSKNSLTYLTPREIVQVIKQLNLVGEGVVLVKKRLNVLIQSKTKDEFNKVMTEIGDLVTLSEDIDNDRKVYYTNILRELYVKKGDRDINTVTDHAKMLNQRVEDMGELSEHTQKRNIIRNLRKAKQHNEKERFEELVRQWESKFGKSTFSWD